MVLAGVGGILHSDQHSLQDTWVCLCMGAQVLCIMQLKRARGPCSPSAFAALCALGSSSCD